MLVANPKSIIISNEKKEIMQMLVDDLPRKQIAHKMKIDIRSIEGYLTTLKKNFGVESVYALIAVLFRKGIIK